MRAKPLSVHRSRTPRAERVAPASTDESLIEDARARLRPAEMVEGKLYYLLKEQVMPVSCLRLSSPAVRRSHC